MSIDWITVSAQIVNFLILVALLKRFLYQPVLDAMDRREERIAARLAEAEQRERQAKEEATRYQRRLDAFDQERDALLTRTREDVEAERKRLLEQARRDADQAREDWKRQVGQEKDALAGNLRRRLAETIQTLVRKVLGDLADARLEEQMVEAFIDKLEHLPDDERRALTEGPGTVTIVSAFELDSRARSRLTRALHEHLGPDTEVSYTRSEGLICGIALTRQGLRLSWNVADYTNELAGRVEDAFSTLHPVSETS